MVAVGTGHCIFAGNPRGVSGALDCDRRVTSFTAEGCGLAAESSVGLRAQVPGTALKRVGCPYR